MIKKIVCLLIIVFFQNTLPEQQDCCVVVFSHGIADTYKQAFWYAKSYTHNETKHTNDRYLFSCPFVTFNYPDATEGPLRVRYQETSFGQRNEMKRLHSAYKKATNWAQQKWNDCNIILFGLSRGASNVGIFAGTHELEHVKAIILESPYFNLSEVISNMLQRSGLGWIPLSYGESVAEFIFKRYNRHGASPATTVDNIPLDMPILIICSKEDQLVPWTSSLNVYKKLIETGHKNTHILILDHGKHAKILSGESGDVYQAVTHAFFKKYNLSYSPSKAMDGEFLLTQCQPPV